MFKKIVIDNNDFITDIIIDTANEGDSSDEIKVIKILDEIIKEDPNKGIKFVKEIKKLIKTCKKPKSIKDFFNTKKSNNKR